MDKIDKIIDDMTGIIAAKTAISEACHLLEKRRKYLVENDSADRTSFNKWCSIIDAINDYLIDSEISMQNMIIQLSADELSSRKTKQLEQPYEDVERERKYRDRFANLSNEEYEDYCLSKNKTKL